MISRPTRRRRGSYSASAHGLSIEDLKKRSKQVKDTEEVGEAGTILANGEKAIGRHDRPVPEDVLKPTVKSAQSLDLHRIDPKQTRCCARHRCQASITSVSGTDPANNRHRGGMGGGHLDHESGLDLVPRLGAFGVMRR